MKKILFFVAFSLFISCSGDSESESISCSSISSLTITQEQDQLRFNFATTGTPTSYQLSYSNDSEFDPNSVNTIDVQSSNSSISLSGLSSGNQTLYFCARTICPDGSLGPWSGKRSFFINDYCVRPRELTYGYQLEWEDYGSGSSYQVQYGVSGFGLGSGTIISTSQEYLDDIPMNGSTSYDFYVRTNCGGSSGWSAWTGPHTYFNEETQFMCSKPTGLYHNLAGSGQVALHWDYNGETLFEYTLVYADQSPSQGVIYTTGMASIPNYFINTEYNYKFYVRAICINGNRTAWASYQFSI